MELPLMVMAGCANVEETKNNKINLKRIIEGNLPHPQYFIWYTPCSSLKPLAVHVENAD